MDSNDLLNTIRRTAYAQALADFSGDEAKASQRAWEAVRNAGYYQDKEGYWTRKNETDASWYHWNNYWRRVKYANIFNVGAMESLGRVPPSQGMKFFRARILAAVPGKSLNGRIYSRETLQQATPLYEGKPFIFDHIIDDVEKVAGIISSPRYGVEEGWDGQKREGLWLETVGMCSEGIFDRLAGKGPVPPLIRGVSIGGQGDGQYNTDGGIVIKNFQPAELSVTAFPGIPEAQIADIRMVSESVKNVKLPGVYPKWEEVQRYRMNIPLEQAEKNVKRSLEKAGVNMPIREIGSGPGQTNMPVVPSSPRPGIRGLNAQMDSDVRTNTGGDFIVPNQTYGSNKGLKVDPYNTPSGMTPYQSVGATPYGNLKGQSSTEGSATGAGYGAKSSRDSTGWSIKTPSLGKTTTKTPGFGKLGPSGSGISDEEEERARVQRTVASLLNDLKGVQYEMMTGKKLEAKVDVSKQEEEEEEEEESKERRVLLRRLARLEQKKVTRELSYDLGNQNKPGGGPMPDAAVTDYQRTRISLPNPGAVQGTIAQGFWNPPNEASGADSTGFDKSAMHVTSGRPAGAGGFVSDPNEFVAANPVRSGGEEEEEEEEERQLLWKRLIQLGLEDGLKHEATGQTMPKTSTSITNPIPKLGNTTTKTPGFGKLSPSGTGLTDQDEEERYILYRLDMIKQKREASPTVDKQEEEEEERYLTRRLITLRTEQASQPSDEAMNRSPASLINQEEEAGTNPLAAAAGVTIKQEEEETRVPDVNPVEGSATAFPLGNVSLWQRFIKPNPLQQEQRMRESLQRWDELKQPKPEPVRQVRVRMEESARPIQQKAKTVVESLPGVPAKGMMTTSPTFRDTMGYQSQDTRAMRGRLSQVLQEVEKTPFGKYNLGGNIWKAMLPELIVRE